MAGRGLSLQEFEAVLPGPASVRITASPTAFGQWVTVRWPCGCRAEGYRLRELLLTERCLRHRTVRLHDLAAAGTERA